MNLYKTQRTRPSTIRTGGYTIVELMVVVVVIGVLSAIALPNFVGRNARNRCEGAARDVSVRMQMARQKAVSSRMPHRMVFDVSERTYYFEKFETDSTWTQDPAEVYEIKGLGNFTTSVGGSSLDNEILFETRGTLATADSPVLFTFISTESDSASLSVVRTGRSSITMAYN